MIAGDKGLERLRASRGWPSLVREAGRFADTQYPAEYPAEAIDDLRLDVPITVYTGGQSHPGLQALAHHLSEVIPGADLVVLPRLPTQCSAWAIRSIRRCSPSQEADNSLAEMLATAIKQS